MDAWLDFLLVALALGIGWLGWVLLKLSRLAGHARQPRRQPHAGRATADQALPEPTPARQRQVGDPEP